MTREELREELEPILRRLEAIEAALKPKTEPCPNHWFDPGTLGRFSPETQAWLRRNGWIR